MNFKLLNTQYICMRVHYSNLKYKNTKQKDLVIFVFILSIALVLNIIIVGFAYFFNTTSVAGTITLSEVDFSIIEPEYINLNILPNITIQKMLKVGNFRNGDKQDFKKLADIFLRFSCEVLLNEQTDTKLSSLVTLQNQNNFIYHNGYYYYCGEIAAGEIVDICNGINFSNNIDNKYQSKPIQLQFSVEAIQSKNQAYKELWQDFPPEWEKTILNI